MKSLTVCITSFKRASHLRRAIDSCVAAGVKNIVVFSMCPDAEVLAVAKSFSGVIDFHSLPVDLGCNELWLQAAYHAKTKHIIILHDDDMLLPEFGQVYRETIKPALFGHGVGFASWRGHAKHDDGRIRELEYMSGPTRIRSSLDIENMVGHRGRLSLSPIISVFDRRTLIHACKEAADHLPFLHPGMILGTEILVYLRHCANFRSWLYVDKVLSHYGCWEGSGTTSAEQANNLAPLIAGYDYTRNHFKANRVRAPHPLPSRFITVTAPFHTDNAETAQRFADVKRSWDFQFNLGRMLDFSMRPEDLSRTSASIGDSRNLPYLKDVLDYGVSRALDPEDVVVYSNLDVAFTVNLPARLAHTLNVAGGVAVVWRRTMKFDPNQYYETVRGGVQDGGVDVIAVTPKWWALNRDRLPDMFVSSSHWDFVFRVWAEQVSNGKCYLHDGVYHAPHKGVYDRIGHTTPAQKHNRDAAKKFFTQIGKHKLAAMLP